MTLVQELTTLESIAALTISDLRAVRSEHDDSRKRKEMMIAFLVDCQKDIDIRKVQAVIHRQ